ncbi:uncharacterized protein LOC129581040 isoform X2 [Paramacrobiotus metropolitanus]|uniref:uncharacterized protein LOC129581040 isoform X2 n=1 Tax=Paramacrobiotus metropolitanus TaxID=2943436 RepID=UPI00244571E2|nr:uncharacterized protein LOC129581040 isoform X2 [Paramacrobiotus metropolitanus]
MATDQITVTAKTVLPLPTTVEHWLNKCLMESQHGDLLTLHQRSRPECFGDGYIAWCLLHHYFPRDINMTAFRTPHSRHEYAEIWSQVDLVLRKHSLPRFSADLVAAVVKGCQSAKAVLLMLLYEALTNLKLPRAIPQFVPERGDRKGGVLRATPVYARRYSASFIQLLQGMYGTSQNVRDDLFAKCDTSSLFIWSARAATT